MARLYIFAIGGTGSRVLKSLTFLLASGIKPNTDKEYEIVPIIIDPHKSNEDLKRTERLMFNYQQITQEIGKQDGFFSTKLTTLDNIVRTKNRISGSFTYNLQQVSNTKFKDYINYNQLDEPTKALSDILFSGKTINKRGDEVNLLDIEMDIGFVGNPNIGSVVLNQVKDSEEFKEFANNFNEAEGDRIFIISSIFGGTGAAGFPTLLKNIRNAKKGNLNVDSQGSLENAMIGAITVLPYFNIEKDSTSPIQKSDFIAKTKAALYYYKDNLTGNNSINALYYISDDYSGKPYVNDPGDNGQKNDAHFIEMLSALAIIDFLEIPDTDLLTEDGKALSPIYREFGLKKNSSNVQLSDFEVKSEEKLSLRLTQMVYMYKYIKESLKVSIKRDAWFKDKPAIDDKFINSPFYKTHLCEFFDAFFEWMNEMANNQRGFSPFKIDAPLHTIINDRPHIERGVFSSKVDYSMLNSNLSKRAIRKEFQSPTQKLISLLFEATEDILVREFGLKKY